MLPEVDLAIPCTTMTLSEYVVLVPAGLSVIGLLAWLAGAVHARIARAYPHDREAASRAG